MSWKLSMGAFTRVALRAGLVAGVTAGSLASMPTPASAQVAAMGFVSIESDPPAHVFIDDADTGSDTPLTRYQILAGHRKLRLVATDGSRKHTTLRVVIAAGEEKHVRVNM